MLGPALAKMALDDSRCPERGRILWNVDVEKDREKKEWPRGHKKGEGLIAKNDF